MWGTTAQGALPTAHRGSTSAQYFLAHCWDVRERRIAPLCGVGRGEIVRKERRVGVADEVADVELADDVGVNDDVEPAADDEVELGC